MQSQSKKYLVAAEIEKGKEWQCRSEAHKLPEWGAYISELRAIIHDNAWEIRIKPKPCGKAMSDETEEDGPIYINGQTVPISWRTTK